MNRSKPRQRGSVLIIVLILMTVSVSLALYTVSVSRDIVTASAQLLDNLQARLDSGSALEKLKYIGATGRFSTWNLENLSASKEFPLQLNLRGTPITLGNSQLRLQDTAGKLGIWPPHGDTLRKLLLLGGVKPDQVAIAVDSLQDWVDADDLKHLNGAEEYYYRSEQGLGYGPRNDPLIQTLGELELIRGFRGRVFDLVKDELVESGGGSLNLSTADTQLMAAVLNIDPESARRLVQLRDKKGVLARTDLLGTGGNGLTFIDESFIDYPSKKLIVDIDTRVNDAGDSLHAIISFQPATDRLFTIEKLTE